MTRRVVIAVGLLLTFVAALQLGLAQARVRRAREDFQVVVWAHHRKTGQVHGDFAALCRRWDLQPTKPFQFRHLGAKNHGLAMVEQRFYLLGLVPVRRQFVLEHTYVYF